MSKTDDSPKPAAPSATAPAKPDPIPASGTDGAAAHKPARANEIGGPAWPEPTRYGDWERGGRVSDF